MNDDSPYQSLRAQQEGIEADQAAHLREYHDLRATPSVFRARLRISYRCQKDQLLLDVWIDSDGRSYRYQPRYHIPPARETEESTTQGREKHKTGGKWNEQVGPLTNEPGGGVLLQCQHCKQFVSNSELTALAAEAGHRGEATHRRV